MSTPEQRAEWRRESEQQVLMFGLHRGDHQTILTLLGELEPAEKRIEELEEKNRRLWNSGMVDTEYIQRRNAEHHARIAELEAALRPAIERCQCQKRVLLDAWIPCEACREAITLLDTEVNP